MKNIYAFIFCAFSFLITNAQNIGIGTNTPVQTLDVNGAIKIGNSTNNQAGSIRYNGGTFEGGNGTTWKNLEGLPSKSIIISQTADTTSIKAAGFSVFKQMDIWDTVNISIGTNYPGSWSSGFPVSVAGVTPATPYSGESVLYDQKLIYYGADAYLYQYDIVAQKWTKLPNISPLGVRNYCGVTLVGTNIYVTGGWKYSGGFIFYNDAAKYNLLTNTWATIANMPVPCAFHGTAAIGTDIYLLGGYGASDFIVTKKMYKYNTLTNTWSADLSTVATPTYISSATLVAYNNKLVWHNGLLKIYAYDPVAGTNTDLDPATTAATSYDFGGMRLSVASNKLYMLASLKDTTAVDPSTEYNMPAQYELDFTSGQLVKLNVCQFVPNFLCYQFNAADNKGYCIGINNSSNATYDVFNRSGAQQCNVILKRRGYWYYMKKN